MLTPVPLTCTLMTPREGPSPSVWEAQGWPDPHTLSKGHREHQRTDPFLGSVGQGLGASQTPRGRQDSSQFFTWSWRPEHPLHGGPRHPWPGAPRWDGADRRVRKAGATLPAWQLPETKLCFSKLTRGLQLLLQGGGAGVGGPTCSQRMWMHSACGPRLPHGVSLPPNSASRDRARGRRCGERGKCKVGFSPSQACGRTQGHLGRPDFLRQ